MEYNQKNLFKNSIKSYPMYIKNKLLKQFEKSGIVLDKSKQLSLDINDNLNVNPYKSSLDLSHLDTVDEKLDFLLEQDSLYYYFERFRLDKEYRYVTYFTFDEIDLNALDNLVSSNKARTIDKNCNYINLKTDIPILETRENKYFLKFEKELFESTKYFICYPIICVIDLNTNVIEISLDIISNIYKTKHDFYRKQIDNIINFLTSTFIEKINYLDFKSVLEYFRLNEDINDDLKIYAKKMTRNGTTAYLEAFDDQENTIPILGEIYAFIETNQNLFSVDENTLIIEDKLTSFLKEIELKSDLPMVKIKLRYQDKKDEKTVKLGITHNYKEAQYSFFNIYDSLKSNRRRMDYVRDYFIGCYKDFYEKTQSISLSDTEDDRIL